MSEIWQLSATELAQRIARRELSSTEVVNAHLARIDAVNPSLNANVRVLADEARAAAELADRARSRRDRRSVVGVPALAQAVVPMDAQRKENPMVMTLLYQQIFTRVRRRKANAARSF